MPNTLEDIIAQSRACSTNEEREVLALEAIADHIRLLVEILNINPSDSRSSSEVENRDLRAAASSENESGGLNTDSVEMLGIKRSVINQFEIGGYRYTNLDDAIAEAKRQHRLAAAI